MKKMRMAVAVLLALTLCLALTACGVSKDDVVGTWTGTWTYNGNSFAKAFVLSENGTYASTTLKNGAYHETQTGTYAISGNKVELHPENEAGTTVYKYKNGTLINNDHVFVKGVNTQQDNNINTNTNTNDVELAWG